MGYLLPLSGFTSGLVERNKSGKKSATQPLGNRGATRLPKQISITFFAFSDDQFVNAACYLEKKRFQQIFPWSYSSYLSISPFGNGVLHYIEGRQRLKTIGLSPDNAHQVLQVTKAIDLLFIANRGHKSRSTYKIRRLILKISTFALGTNEVFTRSLSPENYNNPTYLTDLNSWVKERTTCQYNALTKQIQEASRLSQHLSKRTMILMRGNTGVGKSWTINYLSQSFPQAFKSPSSNTIEGCLNPDHIKRYLRRYNNSSPLLNCQVYYEGRVLYEILVDFLSRRVFDIDNAIIDTRLLELEDFEVLLRMACLRKSKLSLVDIHSSIWHSIVTVLSRDPGGNDPCVDFEVIRDGYIRSLQNRKKFIERVKEDGNITYQLYNMSRSERILVAQITGSDSQCFDSELLAKSLTISSEEEYEVGDMTINQEMIAQHFYFGNSIPTRFLGMTITKALQKHSLKM
jgi:hypothetical protein